MIPKEGISLNEKIENIKNKDKSTSSLSEKIQQAQTRPEGQQSYIDPRIKVMKNTILSSDQLFEVERLKFINNYYYSLIKKETFCEKVVELIKDMLVQNNTYITAYLQPNKNEYYYNTAYAVSILFKTRLFTDKELTEIGKLKIDTPITCIAFINKTIKEKNNQIKTLE